MAISKVNINGTEYEIGGGSGGLKGYSPRDTYGSVFALLEDGSYKTGRLSTSEKYVYVIIEQSMYVGMQGTGEATDISFTSGSTTYYLWLLIPNTDSWFMQFTGGSN